MTFMTDNCVHAQAFMQNLCLCVSVRASVRVHAHVASGARCSVGVDSPESLEREEAELIGAALILLIDSPVLLKPASNNQLWRY